MIYLDNAATSYPKPECVYERLGSFLRTEGANPGRSSYRMATECERLMDEARGVLTKFFGGTSPERLVFTLNATDALNMAIKGVLRGGDHVITTHLEHNSVSRPLNSLEKEGAISITRIPHSQEGVVDPDDVRKSLTHKTRLVVMTHASNVLGTIQPIEAVGEVLGSTPTLFLVDAAQTAGVMPLDVQKMHIDLLAFPGHKALFGPPGTGGLLVGERATPALWREGGTGGDSSSPLQPEEYPHRLEGGTPNTVGVASLLEGVRFILREGMSKIRRHEEKLVSRLIESLKGEDHIRLYGSRDPSKHVGTVACNVDNVSAQEAGLVLDRSFQIAVRSGLHCAPDAHRSIGTFPEGSLRISPGYFSSEDAIHKCVEALQTLSRSFNG